MYNTGASWDTNPFSTDIKTNAFFTRTNYTEILVVAHNQGVLSGYALYPVLSAASASRTFAQLFQQGSDLVLTGSRSSKGGGAVKLVFPSENLQCCGQTDSGRDAFVDDYSDPLVINRKSGWSAAFNNMRLTTSHNTNVYPHTFGGMGGSHNNADW